jgi:hypothetical protein
VALGAWHEALKTAIRSWLSDSLDPCCPSGNNRDESEGFGQAAVRST